MLRYLVGWFTTTRKEADAGALCDLYFDSPANPKAQAMFSAAEAAGFVAWTNNSKKFDGEFYDLTDAGVEWIRQHLLVDGFRKAKCESCSTLVTTRIPEDAGGKPKRPSCIACEVSRQRSLYVLLDAAKDEPSADIVDGASTQLDLL